MLRLLLIALGLGALVFGTLACGGANGITGDIGGNGGNHVYTWIPPSTCIDVTTGLPVAPSLCGH